MSILGIKGREKKWRKEIPFGKSLRSFGGLIVHGAAGSTRASAADEAENSSEHRYEIINERMTWTEAEAYCEAEGGHLATVGSEEEYAQILEAAGITSRQVL